ncbi:efflux RND transporter periplasmic adaptor subunit [Paenibacillus sp. y28]|uniref:efflux RND transporter periplasmic adaptor subunit n=1 Tax=Paenibacillus sp. y28 TaxID=3129110 RepID=UPI003016D3ED
MAGMLAGCSLLPMEEEELKPPLAPQVKETLTIYEVKRANIARQITGVATFASDKTDYLYFTESGPRLVKLNVKLNDKVKPGDILASTETTDIENKIRLQEISVEKSKIALQQEWIGKDSDDPAIRLKKLDLEGALLQLQTQKDQLQRSRLVANQAGIVTGLEAIKPGDQVTAYTPIITISDPSQMKLVYTASSMNDLAGAEINMEVDVKIKDQIYPGKVVQTPMSAVPSSNKAIQDKNNKSLFIDVPGLPEDITIGSQADITVNLEKRENVIVIPRAGLRSYMGRDYVQVLEGESRKEIDVEKGIVAAREVEIRKGISEGQKIILAN